MRFLNILFLTTALFVAAPAMAQNVFLLQIGSYKSEQEANNTWQDLKKNYKEVLNDLFHQSSSLSLPPSGKKVYRLQAGPFITREDAASACNSLNQKGEDCFIVESAAFAPSEKPVAVADAAIVASDSKAAVISDAPATEAMKVEAPAIVTPSLADEVSPIQEAATPPLAVASSQNSLSLVDQFTQAFAGKEASPVVKTEVKESPANEPEVLNAKKEVKILSTTKAESVLPEEVKKKSTIAVPAAKTKETLVAKKPATTSLPTSIAPIAPEKRFLPAAIASEPTPAPVAKTSLLDIPLPWQKTPKPVTQAESQKVVSSKAFPEKIPFGRVNDPYRPLPTPTTARKGMLTPPFSSLPAETQNISVPEIRDTQDQTVKPKARRLTQNDVISPADSRVKVDEAIAVPLSNPPAKAAAATAEPAKTTSSPTAIAVKDPVLSGENALSSKASPSRNFLQQSYWVQLSYFKDEQAALNHWQILRQKIPVISSKMRIRITKPYIAQSSTARVSLQVGPFLNPDDVTKLCEIAASETINCTTTKDIGTSTSANQQRTRSDTSVLQRRDIIRLRPSAIAQYWVQLGSYQNRGDASTAWDELRVQNIELQSYLPTFTQPMLSSSPEAVYRLRTGPFQIRYAAQELCDSIKNRGAGCLVISE